MSGDYGRQGEGRKKGHEERRGQENALRGSQRKKPKKSTDSKKKPTKHDDGASISMQNKSTRLGKKRKQTSPEKSLQYS